MKVKITNHSKKVKNISLPATFKMLVVLPDNPIELELIKEELDYLVSQSKPLQISTEVVLENKLSVEEAPIEVLDVGSDKCENKKEDESANNDEKNDPEVEVKDEKIEEVIEDKKDKEKPKRQRRKKKDEE